MMFPGFGNDSYYRFLEYDAGVGCGGRGSRCRALPDAVHVISTANLGAVHSVSGSRTMFAN